MSAPTREAVEQALERLREPCTPADRAEARRILNHALRAAPAPTAAEGAESEDAKQLRFIRGWLRDARVRDMYDDGTFVPPSVRVMWLWEERDRYKAQVEQLRALLAAAGEARGAVHGDTALLHRLRQPVDEGGFDGYSMDPLHHAAAQRIEELRRALGTEQTMHAAWRKRAQEAETELAAQARSAALAEARDIAAEVATPEAPARNDYELGWEQAAMAIFNTLDVRLKREARAQATPAATTQERSEG